MAERKWELTPEEILAEGWAALDEWDDKHKASDFPTPDDAAKSWQTLLARAIANAAVKKVVEWLDKNCSVVDNFVLRSCEDPIFDEGDVYFTKDEWRKLRQEVAQ